MFGERGFFPKTPEILEQQIKDAQETLGTEDEHTLVPPSVDAEVILGMPEQQLKEKFARRYEIYRRLTRDWRMIDRGKEDFYLSEAEIEEMKKWLAILNSLDTYIEKHHEGEVTLRGKQIDVFESLRNFLEQGGSEGYVKLPTGVGKTVLFTEFVEALDLKTLIVVPTKILVKQTEKKLKQFAPDLDVGKVYQYAKEHGRQVTLITYDSLASQIEAGNINPADFDCLILDEAHVSLSKKRMDVVKKFDKAIKVGFTATPNFSERKGVSNLLEKEIHSVSIKEAVEEGMLCSVSAIIVRTEADLSNVTINSAGNYDEDELAKAVNIASRNKAAVDLYKGAYDGELAVAYCVGVEHARAVALEFQKAGVSAVAISGKTPEKEQEKILEMFNAGEIKVVCNADLLIAGFDEPKASLCLNLRPMRSRVAAEQRGGRVLRLDETRPDKHASIVDFLDQGISETDPPVLFAEVAEGAFFTSQEKRKREGGGGSGGTGRSTPLIIDIPGLDIVSDAEEVMKIMRKMVLKRENKKINDYPSLKAAVQAAVAAGEIKINVRSLIKTYIQLQKLHPEWPKSLYSMNGFVSHEDLFGLKKFDYPSLKAAVQAAVAAGEISVDVNRLLKTYAQLQKLHPEWPVGLAHVDDFMGIEDLFGVKKVNNYSLLRTAVQAAVAAGEVTINLKSLKKTYAQLQKLHPEWPVSLSRVDSLEDLFGVKKVNNYSLLRTAVQAAVAAGEVTINLKSLKKTYAQLQKLHPEWPVSLAHVDGFLGVQDLFGVRK